MEKQTRTIALANMSGGQILEGLELLLKALPKDSRKIIIELPCVGWPRIGYTLTQVGSITKEQTIDQLLLDLDRQQSKPLSEYIVHRDGVDYLLIDPRAQPEAPVIRKIKTNETLIAAPTHLRQQLSGLYEWIIFVTQGLLMHPMTHFALRTADATVLYSGSPLEVVGNLTHYKRLTEVFGVIPERLALFSSDTNMKLEVPLVGRFSELVKRWSQADWPINPAPARQQPVIEGQEAESVGLIEPLEYLAYQVPVISSGNEITASDAEKLDKLLNFIRHRLQSDHLDEYIQSLTQEPARQKVRYYISDLVREQTEFVFIMPLIEVIEWVQKEITELGVLQEVLDDKSISSIEINDVDQVIVEQNGKDIHRPDIRFQSVKHIYDVINKMLMPIGKPISSTEPIVDANYRGFRICVVADNHEYQGVSANAPLISIRKFPPDVYSNEQCIQYGNISQEIADFLAFIVPKGANILISGGTNSGKTTQLIRLPLFVDPITRIISIEDSEEMMLACKTQYKHYPNLPSLLVKDVEDEKKSYGIDKLIKACLRLRPEVMCIGEIRDESAARQALIGMNTGHVVWTTIHANSAKEAATRFLQLNGNTPAAASQIAGSIDLIIFQKKLPSGVRVVTEISELLGYRGTEEPILNPIFKYDNQVKRHIRVGKLKSESLLEKIYLKNSSSIELQRWCEGKELRAL
ncbi:CpaF family protein [Paenibacillus graminis]|uniref:CpaF family protein n=1 Tax=Paenibacillus graminis TaxID=189425 RepID=UPI002DB92F99|nr:ATPase, T2SS/T4P/T4SS family [Paenibacillus graminis]MEC0167373.1 ATPase, T2SS/T4P/T4SS family [Paenibacillus graminis]